ncbi:hypothetical protein SBRCBS47491_009330 [Sporothrix bragantina]|uniref:Xaa-Pro dipeptidyl-peptidase C-terminal domain-containing protein n=1 Tax=Sporothrix bragantina TaxID=671064 RepID=A0ABP0CUS4_9PEZI
MATTSTIATIPTRDFYGLEIPQVAIRPVTADCHYTPSKTPGGSHVLSKGTVIKEGHMPLPVDIILEQDVAIIVRDGITIYADVYRPANTHETVPAIIAGGPFSKNGGPNKNNFNKWPWRFGCPRIATSGLEKFEGPDPAYWCLHGYAIVHTDCRGTWNSTGNVIFPSRKEGEDNYDIIEFLAAQTWCSGKVSMAGNSYLSMTQWFAGAANPPHLACLAPWEGVSDTYNDMVRIGGSPDPGFTLGLITGDIASNTGSKGDNVTEVCYKYPTWNEYWQQHHAELDKITVPLYIVASWTNALHTYGTLRAWQEVSSTEKWLRVHNTHEWPDLYQPQSREDLRKFFDYYMKDAVNDWPQTPKVRLSVLDAGGRDIVNRPEPAFPLARTQPLKLYLNAADNTASTVAPTESTSVSHDAVSGTTVFRITFPTKTELTGYSKLRLWAEAQGSDDMDIFVIMEKFDTASGKLLESCVTDVGYLQDDPAAERKKLIDGHAADPAFGASYFNSGPTGRLRASHRELDSTKATDLNPVYTHREEQMLKPGQILPLDIGFWPYSWTIHSHQELRLRISGFNPKPHLRPNDKPAVLRNKGHHVFYTGGERASFLLLPLIPLA